MTDVAEIKTETLTPEQEAQKTAQEDAAKRQAEIQQNIQMMEQQIQMGRRSITLNCLNLAGAALSFLPRPDEDMEPTKGKKQQHRRTLTLADLDRVSAIIERFTNSVANCSQSSMGPGMMGPRGPMGR